MLKWLIAFIILLIVGCHFSDLFITTVFCAISNPHYTSGYGFSDLYHYIKYKCWRNAYAGELVCFTGLFGKGKTLSCVHTITSFYYRYNGLMVYDKNRKKFVRQRVVVLSNIELKSIPYAKLESLKQIVDVAHELKREDLKFNTITYLLVLGDEFSVQLNSRNFKINIDPLFLNTLLTCRHYNISIYYTAQRFSIVDALLRQVTQTVIECDKLWRFQRQRVYDAYQLENCTNPLLVEPQGRRCWFVRNKDYGAYDTLACVDKLEHSAIEGDMLSAEQILQAIQPQLVDSVVQYSKKAKKRKLFKVK